MTRVFLHNYSSEGKISYQRSYEYCEQGTYFTDVKYIGARCQGPILKNKIIFPFSMYFTDLYKMEHGVVMILILVFNPV